MTISTVLRKPPVILAAGTLLVALVVFFRIHALYPTVFSDEWTYSRMSRLDALSQAEIPSFLYLSTYRLTNVCGDGFLSCARLMNVAFFFSAIPFIYLIARKVATPALAVWIALLVAINPMNSYTAYFMPEAMFFFAFWLFAWCLLRLDAAHKSVDLIVPAVLFGFMALVKPHPIFMYPALIVYLGYMSRQATYAAWLRLWAMRSAIFVGVSLLAKLAISSIFAGKAGLTLFGGRYEALAERMDGGTERYIAIASNAVGSLSGHLMILAVLFGTAICVLLYIAMNGLFQKEQPGEAHKIAIFGFLVIGSMIALSAIFTAAVMGLAPAESLARVHMRYYNFSLPLLLILAGAGIADNPHRRINVVAAITVAIAGLTAYAIGTRISGFTPSWIDAPEATAAAEVPESFYLVAAFGLFTTIAWAVNQRLGSRIFLLAFAPVMILLNLYAVNRYAQQFEQPDAADRAGIVAHQLFQSSELRNVTVYGLDFGYISKILFHIDSPLAKYVQSDRGTLPNFEAIRNTNKIAVVLGPTLGAPTGTTEIQGDGFSIIRSANPELYVDFTRQMPSGALADTTGMSLPESWGAWSEGALVTLKFRKNLPESLRVHLRAKAFGPNVGKPFTMRVGDQTRDFSLTDVPRNIELKFGNPGASDTITIAVPQPASPHETGVGGDPRKLGIAMIEFRIEKLDGSGN
ncbi:MAG: glycosyltransferase family 39 protein [Afipia sp.]|nr:glycosyltransferase family 39 protein [Afipia sp.]